MPRKSAEQIQKENEAITETSFTMTEEIIKLLKSIDKNVEEGVAVLTDIAAMIEENLEPAEPEEIE